jgi:hypothetical protein
MATQKNIVKVPHTHHKHITATSASIKNIDQSSSHQSSSVKETRSGNEKKNQ